MFLGIYDYTVILTYISLGISVFGISRALEGDFKVAIFCLALSGLCDMFDGKIARTKKNRTDDEKNFGIQIDSLCDVVCFGIFPVMFHPLKLITGAYFSGNDLLLSGCEYTGGDWGAYFLQCGICHPPCIF